MKWTGGYITGNVGKDKWDAWNGLGDITQVMLAKLNGMLGMDWGIYHR